MSYSGIESTGDFDGESATVVPVSPRFPTWSHPPPADRAPTFPSGVIPKSPSRRRTHCKISKQWLNADAVDVGTIAIRGTRPRQPTGLAIQREIVGMVPFQADPASSTTISGHIAGDTG